MQKKVAFIVNPNAGTRKKIDIPSLIKSNFSKDIPSEIIIWDDKFNFQPIEKKLLEEGFTVAVAVGGDGTVNQVAKTVNRTEISLGIIPFGSGNGLARSLGIPMDPIKAIKRIENGSIKKIDSGSINGTPFFCTSGVGFDAHIGNLFATSTSRGLWTYTKITIKELFGYKPKEYKLTFNGGTITRKAFLVTFANAGQYGNDFYIAPEARMDDGLLHVAILKPFSLFAAPAIVSKIIRRKANKSAYIETFTTKELQLERAKSDSIHYDGEPERMPQAFEVNINTLTLQVLC
jgi:YegS/Rv2252/BmrU family lipid kinase